MGIFLKNNWKLLLMITLFGIAIIGGIAMVESSLSGQVTVID